MFRCGKLTGQTRVKTRPFEFSGVSLCADWWPSAKTAAATRTDTTIQKPSANDTVLVNSTKMPAVERPHLSWLAESPVN
jgi:hypothetical protein